VTTEPPEVPRRERRLDRLRLRGRRVEAWHIGLVAGVLAAVVIGGYLWLSGDDPAGQTAGAPDTETAERGVACPHLYEAFVHNQAGDLEALRRSVDAAAQVGEEALEQSGQEFGRPEEIAIELHSLGTSGEPDTAQTASFLQQAQSACEAVDRWAARD
jgi:hypothetical protein